MDLFKAVFPKEAIFDTADAKIGAKFVRKNSEISAVITGWTKVHGLDKLAEAVREKNIPWFVITGRIEEGILSYIEGLGAKIIDSSLGPEDFLAIPGIDPESRIELKKRLP